MWHDIHLQGRMFEQHVIRRLLRTHETGRRNLVGLIGKIMVYILTQDGSSFLTQANPVLRQLGI